MGRGSKILFSCVCVWGGIVLNLHSAFFLPLFFGREREGERRAGHGSCETSKKKHRDRETSDHHHERTKERRRPKEREVSLSPFSTCLLHRFPSTQKPTPKLSLKKTQPWPLPSPRGELTDFSSIPARRIGRASERANGAGGERASRGRGSTTFACFSNFFFERPPPLARAGPPIAPSWSLFWLSRLAKERLLLIFFHREDNRDGVPLAFRAREKARFCHLRVERSSFPPRKRKKKRSQFFSFTSSLSHSTAPPPLAPPPRPAVSVRLLLFLE